MKVLVNLDLGLNQLLNVALQVLASDPSSPVAAQIYYNSTTHLPRIWNGSAWIELAPATSDASTLETHAGSYYLDRANHTGTQSADTLTDGTTNKAFLATERTKLAGIATGATANSSDATLLARANHTGTQLASTISDFDTQVRTSRLDQMAVPTADVSLNSHKLTNLTDPSSAQDAATKAYVDATAQGLDVKASVRAATTGNITLSGAQTIDGVSVIAGDRVLVKAQTTGANNGIYVAAAGAWARATDADSSAKVTPGLFVFVEEGTTNADTGWVLTTNAAIVLATTALVFTQFSGAGSYTNGTGLTLTGNTFAIDTASGYGVRKYAVDVGDNSSTAIVITHSLNSRDVEVQLHNASTPWEVVMPDIEMTSVNTVTLRFATAPTTAQYRAVVIG